MTDAERIADLERQLAEALHTIGELRRELEEWKRGHRERRKRRSSRAEGVKRVTGVGPGRPFGAKGSNRPVPTEIHREEHHPVPACCPDCGGEVEVGPDTQSTIVQDIPPIRVENVRHVGCVGKCKGCGKRVAAKLPGMSRLGDAASQVLLGPNLTALGLSLRFEEHVSLYGIRRLFGNWLGVQVSASGLSQLFTRTRMRTAPATEEIKLHVRSSGLVSMDETTLRQNGAGAWVWLARTDDASWFRVELSRGAWVADEMIGEGFTGTICSDFYGAYTRRDDWTHGYCGAHTIREAKKIAEVTSDPLAQQFSDRLRSIFREGQEAQASGDVQAREHVKRRMRYLAGSTAFTTLPDVVRLQNRIDEHFDGIMLYVDRPDVPMTNNAAERDVRPIALHRNVTGGTRSATGSDDLAHWMSVSQTLKKNGMPLRAWIVAAWDAHLAGRPPPSVFPAPN